MRAIAEAGGIAVVASRSAAKKIGRAPAGYKGGLIDSVAVDVTSSRDLDRALRDVHKRHGRITGVVNSTLPKGPGYGRRFEDVDFADFCQTVGAHLGGAFLVCQRAVRYFVARGGGTIINFGSIYGFLSPRFEIYDGTPMTKEIEYVVSKAGILQMTSYLAKYLKNTGVRVNCVSPGGVLDGQNRRFIQRYTRFCAGKGMLDASDVAGSVLFLLSEASRHITGQNIVVDDGFSL